MTTNAADSIKLALLVDGDNMRAEAFPDIMASASNFGVIAIRRLYGQFSADRMKSWAATIEEFNLACVDVKAVKAGKNAVDIRLTIEAVGMLTGRGLDGICIVSNDSDYTPLAAHIRASALVAVGFGAEKVPPAYKEAFDTYVPLREVERPAPKAKRPAAAKEMPAKPAAKSIGTPPARIAKPIPEAAIYKAVQDGDKDGRSLLSVVGNHLKRAIPGFKVSDYGVRTLAKLIAKLPRLKIQDEGQSRVFVRYRTP